MKNRLRMISPVAANESRPVEQFAHNRVAWATTPRLFWIIAVVSVLVLCQYQFWNLPSRGDRANWDYFSQVISRGGVPYRDVVNIKTPLSAYIGAAAITLTRPFGLREIYATRATYLLLTALTIAFTFLVASRFFNCRRVGLLAALILLGTEQFATLNSDGVQPKTPMVLLGLISLWAALRNRPFLAGSSAMLSALSWQPGLLFFGAACLALSRYFTGWRDRAWLRLLAGAALPLLLFLAYLWVAGATGDFYRWCLHFNFSVYAPREMTTAQAFTDRFSFLVEESFPQERIYLFIAAAGLLAFILREALLGLKAGLGALLDRAAYHQVAVTALVYLAFCRINMQGEQDFIPLLPFMAIFAALILVWAIDMICALIARTSLDSYKPRLALITSAALFSVAAFDRASDLLAYRAPRRTLEAQDADVRAIAGRMNPGDQIFVHGRTEMLALSGMTNSRKYTNLDHGKDNFLNQVEPGGFDGWLEQLKMDRPRVVMLSRMEHVDRKQDFFDWVERDYEKVDGEVFNYYVRKGP
jgi:hypothetical protein